MRNLLVIAIIVVFVTIATEAPAYGAVKGITAENYTTWEKTYPDSPGYNKGECEPEYSPGEEYFYNEYIDHWNVDKVYDASLIPANWGKTTKATPKAKTDRELVKEFCKKHYKKNPKYVKAGSKAIKHHKGKMLVEVIKSKSTGKGYGKTTKGEKVRYNKTVKKGKIVTSYLIYSPKTNAPDAVVAVVDNKVIR